MLVKASPAGKGFSGKIDYLYEGRLAERDGNNKKAQLIIHSDNLRVPNDFQDKSTRKLLKKDFIFQAKQHRTYGKGKNSAFVGEHILSFTNEDKKKLTPSLLKTITEDYISLSGIDKTQFIAISHKDTANIHVHILFNRAMNDGKKYDAWKEQNKTIERGIALALKYDFKLVKNQLQIAQSKEVIQLRSTMQDIHDLRKSNELFSVARNLLHLEKMCQANGIAFSKDERLMTVSLDNQVFQEANLKAVFLLNRQQVEKVTINEQEKTFKKEIGKSINQEEQTQSIELKNAKKTTENERVRFKKKKQKTKGYEIKIENLKKMNLKKGRGI